MVHAHDLFAQRRPPGVTNPTALLLYKAVVASSPAALTDDVFVTVPGMDDGETLQGPCDGWAPRVDIAGVVVLPVAGDAAWVQFDDNDDPVITAWRPAW